MAVLTAVAAAVCLRWPDPEVPRRPDRSLDGRAVGLAVVALGAAHAGPGRHHPGNLTILGEHLLEPAGGDRRLAGRGAPGAPTARRPAPGPQCGDGPGRAREVDETGASALRGATLLGALGLATVAVRQRGGRGERAAVGLAVLAVGVAFTSAAHVVGHPWGYLTLWMWPVAVLAVLASAAATLTWRAGPAGGPAQIRQRWASRP